MKHYLIKYFTVGMLLFTQLSPAQNESSKTNNTLINKYIEKVQSRFSGANIV